MLPTCVSSNTRLQKSPFVLSTIDIATSGPIDGWNGYGKDILVLSETLIATLSINNIINMAVRRPRPLVFDHVNFTEEERLDSPEQSS